MSNSNYCGKMTLMFAMTEPVMTVNTCSDKEDEANMTLQGMGGEFGIRKLMS